MKIKLKRGVKPIGELNLDTDDEYFDTYEEYITQFKIEETDYLKQLSDKQKEVWFAYRKGILDYTEAVRIINDYGNKERWENISNGYKEWKNENKDLISNRVSLEEYKKLIKK